MTEFEQKVLTELAALSQSVADSGSLIILVDLVREAQVRAESAVGVLTTEVGSVLQELGDVKNGIALLIEGKAQILDKLAGIAQSIKEQNELFASVVGEEIANLNRRLDEIAVALMPQRGGHYTVPPQTT